MSLNLCYLIITSIVLIQLSISSINCQSVYHENEDLEGIHPKADWREVITQLAGPVWCSAKLSVKALWCAGTSAYDWLQMGVQQTDRQYCCYMFDTSVCIAGAAKQMCSQTDYNKIVALLHSKTDELIANQCSAFGYQWYDWKSWKCHFPIVPFIFATVFILITFVIIRKFPNNNHFLSNNWGAGHRLGRH